MVGVGLMDLLFAIGPAKHYISMKIKYQDGILGIFNKDKISNKIIIKSVQQARSDMPFVVHESSHLELARNFTFLDDNLLPWCNTFTENNLSCKICWLKWTFPCYYTLLISIPNGIYAIFYGACNKKNWRIKQKTSII